ncbi:haloacid dehalogenase, partial [Mycobacterium sp. ITM-2017-0098]
MQNNGIRLAVVGHGGAGHVDDGLVIEAFEVAAEAGGLPDSGPEREHARQYVLDTMGQSKIT